MMLLKHVDLEVLQNIVQHRRQAILLLGENIMSKLSPPAHS
jgi:hypothetical protein